MHIGLPLLLCLGAALAAPIAEGQSGIVLPRGQLYGWSARSSALETVPKDKTSKDRRDAVAEEVTSKDRRDPAQPESGILPRGQLYGWSARNSSPETVSKDSNTKARRDAVAEEVTSKKDRRDPAQPESGVQPRGQLYGWSARNSSPETVSKDSNTKARRDAVAE